VELPDPAGVRDVVPISSSRTQIAGIRHIRTSTALSSPHRVRAEDHLHDHLPPTRWPHLRRPPRRSDLRGTSRRPVRRRRWSRRRLPAGLLPARSGDLQQRSRPRGVAASDRRGPSRGLRRLLRGRADRDAERDRRDARRRRGRRPGHHGTDDAAVGIVGGRQEAACGPVPRQRPDAAERGAGRSVAGAGAGAAPGEGPPAVGTLRRGPRPGRGAREGPGAPLGPRDHRPHRRPVRDRPRPRPPRPRTADGVASARGAGGDAGDELRARPADHGTDHGRADRGPDGSGTRSGSDLRGASGGVCDRLSDRSPRTGVSEGLRPQRHPLVHRRRQGHRGSHPRAARRHRGDRAGLPRAARGPQQPHAGPVPTRGAA